MRIFTLLFCLASLSLSAQQYDSRATIRDTEIGTATFYADASQGLPTASGEPYQREAFTAAHLYYPMGTMLRVTDLDRNRMVEVRVNDRIPEQGDRIVNLSKAAANHLGMLAAGRARVRVERISPVNTPDFTGRYATNNAYASPSAYENTSAPQLTARSPYAYQNSQSGFQKQTPRETYDPKAHGAPDWASQLFRDDTYPTPRAQTAPAPTAYAAPAEYSQNGLTARGYAPPANNNYTLPASSSGYAIQLASYTDTGNAQAHLSQLKAKGFSNAAIWQQDGKNRVILTPFSDRASALEYLGRLRQQLMDGIVVQLR